MTGIEQSVVRPSLVDTAIVFAVSMLVGGFGNWVSVRAVTESEVGYGHAVVSSLLSAAIWGLLVYTVASFPLGGPLVALLVWIGVVYLRYSCGPLEAAVVGVVAWLAAVAALYVLAHFGVVPFQAIGIPGV